jgi:Multicopper oxidase
MSLTEPATNGPAASRWTGTPNWYLCDGGFVALGRTEGLFPSPTRDQRQEAGMAIARGRHQRASASDHPDRMYPDDRPGSWMYHCHILEHHASGMMAHFDVVR